MRRAFVVISVVTVIALGNLTAPAVGAPQAGLDRWALLVGINHFQGRTRPNTGAVGDTDDLHDALRRNGWPEDHIRVLNDSDATAAAIRDGLAWLAGHSNDQTYSLFHYSGHVKQSGNTVYLWPYDNRHIPDVELVDAMNKVQGWAWIDIAGCESAAFDKGMSSARHLVTTSSQGNEKSYEMPPSYKNSVFGFYLFEESLINGGGDTNQDGRVSLQEAFQYAADHATAMTDGQGHGPQHPYMAGGDGHEWFLDPPPPPPPPPPPAPPSSASHCFVFCK